MRFPPQEYDRAHSGSGSRGSRIVAARAATGSLARPHMRRIREL
jgi:hypothetical protein